MNTRWFIPHRLASAVLKKVVLFWSKSQSCSSGSSITNVHSLSNTSSTADEGEHRRSQKNRPVCLLRPKNEDKKRKEEVWLPSDAPDGSCLLQRPLNVLPSPQKSRLVCCVPSVRAHFDLKMSVIIFGSPPVRSCVRVRQYARPGFMPPHIAAPRTRARPWPGGVCFSFKWATRHMCGH